MKTFDQWWSESGKQISDEVIMNQSFTVDGVARMIDKIAREAYNAGIMDGIEGTKKTYKSLYILNKRGIKI